MFVLNNPAVFYTSQMKHRLKEIRKAKRLTQTEMGDIIGVGLRGYQYIEKGERTLDTDHIARLCDHLNVPAWQVFADPETVYPAHHRAIVSAYLSLDEDEKRVMNRLLFSDGHEPNSPLAEHTLHERGDQPPRKRMTPDQYKHIGEI